MKKIKVYKLILQWVMRIVAIHDTSIISESRLAKRLNINKPKIKRNEEN
jgi:hypothetical protein